MKKRIEYILVDNNGHTYHHFPTEAEAEQATKWFPADMEIHVEVITVYGL